MITYSDAYIKRITIDGSSYIVPVEVAKKMQEFEDSIEALNSDIANITAARDTDEFKVASMIIMNLRSDKMGKSKVLTNTEFGILDEFWAELESRIVHGLRGETPSGMKYRPDMIPTISGDDAEAFIESRRKAQKLHKSNRIK